MVLRRKGRRIALLLLFCGVHSSMLISPPRFEPDEPAATTEQPEESDVALSCPARGDPMPLIQWSFNGVPLHELPQTDRRLLLDGGRLLRILRINHDLDSGLYQCNATNFFGHIYAAIFLNVQAFAPRFQMAEQRVWKVIRRSTVDFNCDVEAAPPPTVRWVDANDSAIGAIDEKIHIFPNHTLRLYEASNADEGYYYCNVSNKYGINRAMNKLEVYGRTYFVEVPRPKNSLVDATETVEFRCKANADPRLNVDYLWTHNGKPLNETIARPFFDSVLRLQRVRGHHSGTVQCAAVTDVDVKTASAELVVRDVPEAPTLIRVECAYKAQPTALIVWRRPPDYGSPIVRFAVEARTAFRPDSWERVYEEQLVNRELYKLLLPLSPWVNYTYRIIAYNSYGASAPVESVVDVCATRTDVPYRSPDGVRVFGTLPGNLVIRWNPMDKHDWNAPGLRYLIRYRQRVSRPSANEKGGSVSATLMAPNGTNSADKGGEGGDPSSLREYGSRVGGGTSNGDIWPMVFGEGTNEENRWHEFFVEDPMTNETIVRDQPIYAEYEVQVRAVNADGYSARMPPVYTGFSGEDVPMEAPAHLRLVAFANFSAATLAWEAVAEGSVCGHFRGYRLRYWPTKRPFLAEELYVDNRTLSLTVGGLEALRNYTAEVSVMNGQYAGPAGRPALRFATPEGAPSKVHDLRVRAVGAHSVFATWQPPLQPNGRIRGYFVTFQSVDSSDGFVEETYVLHRQLHYLHESLDADAAYRVAVWAETNGGEGPKVERVARTFSQREPDAVVFTVRASSPHSLNVEWHPEMSGATVTAAATVGDASSDRNGSAMDAASNNYWPFSGTTFYVEYRKAGSDVSSSSAKRWQRSEAVSLPYTTIEVVGLEADTDYELRGVTREGTAIAAAAVSFDAKMRADASSPSVSVRTDSARRSSPHINAENLRNAAWFLVILAALAVTLLLIGVMCCVAQSRLRAASAFRGGAFYDVRARDKHFRRLESVANGSDGGRRVGSITSGGTATTDASIHSATLGTTVPFLDDQSDEHRRFLDASYGELLARRRAFAASSTASGKCKSLADESDKKSPMRSTMPIRIPPEICLDPSGSTNGAGRTATIGGKRSGGGGRYLVPRLLPPPLSPIYSPSAESGRLSGILSPRWKRSATLPLSPSSSTASIRSGVVDAQ